MCANFEGLFASLKGCLYSLHLQQCKIILLDLQYSPFSHITVCSGKSFIYLLWNSTHQYAVLCTTMNHCLLDISLFIFSFHVMTKCCNFIFRFKVCQFFQTLINIAIFLTGASIKLYTCWNSYHHCALIHPSVRDRVRTKMERDILADVNHPFVVKLHYGEPAWSFVSHSFPRKC